MTELADPAVKWPALPPGTAEVMLPGLARAAEEITATIQREVPEYARPFDDSYNRAFHRTIQTMLRQFVQQVVDPDSPRDELVGLFRAVGYQEASDGRSIETVQAAMRTGARVAWRRLCVKAGEGTLGIEVLGALGEAIFLYIDELSAACAEGYARAGAELADELKRRRARLLDLIVASPPASGEAVADRARAAGWALPRQVAVVALEDWGQGFLSPLPALPAEVLVDMARRDPCVLVPDPGGSGRVDAVERSLRGWRGAVGPVVPLSQAGSSLRWARQALALVRRGIISQASGLVRCDEHLSTLLLLADEPLAQVCASARLAPLLRLRPEQQEILAETLLCWLQSAGNARLAARQLHVHPQTVRYRLRHLKELFGDALVQPAARLDLEMALRARLLLGHASPVPAQRAGGGAGLAAR
jgi:PucR C-terminal helix-turn-helix domain